MRRMSQNERKSVAIDYADEIERANECSSMARAESSYEELSHVPNADRGARVLHARATPREASAAFAVAAALQKCRCVAKAQAFATHLHPLTTRWTGSSLAPECE